MRRVAVRATRFVCGDRDFGHGRGSSAVLLEPVMPGTLDGSSSTCGAFGSHRAGHHSVEAFPSGRVYVNPARSSRASQGGDQAESPIPISRRSTTRTTEHRYQVDPPTSGSSHANSDQTRWNKSAFPSETGSVQNIPSRSGRGQISATGSGQQGAHLRLRAPRDHRWRGSLQVGDPPATRSPLSSAVATCRAGDSGAVTASDLFIHGHSGLVVDDLECGRR
jgi:hypothetical protein